MEASAIPNVGFGKRLIAYILDAIVIGIPMMIIQSMFFGPTYDIQTQQLTPAFYQTTGINIIVGILYTIGMWVYADGATLGKKAMKIKVVKKDGSAIDLMGGLLRYVGYWVSTIPCLIGFFWIIFDKQNRGLHDIIAGTRVIDA